ncbi:MAG: 7-cyano-7-deazaguanine synthase [Desulfovibrio sp.]|jgi:7-cyano-7-deazaguanine synthase|nr:7-cyano-7-deazaguanine synthase [Desulfovibrio sp.]
MEGKTVFLSLSGGIDSTTLYAVLLAGKMDVRPVFFLYPSKHNAMEREAAGRVAFHYSGRQPACVDASGLFAGLRSHLLLGGGEIPREGYDEENLRKTVIPGRNTIFLAALAALAESTGEEKVYVAIGVHGGDHAVYPDCRPEYVDSVRRTILLSSLGRVEVIAPFVSLSKAEVVRRGMECSVPYALTRSCYAGTDAPCRVCPTCRAREEAFVRNGCVDPLFGKPKRDSVPPT